MFARLSSLPPMSNLNCVAGRGGRAAARPRARDSFHEPCRRRGNESHFSHRTGGDQRLVTSSPTTWFMVRERGRRAMDATREPLALEGTASSVPMQDPSRRARFRVGIDKALPSNSKRRFMVGEHVRTEGGTFDESPIGARTALSTNPTFNAPDRADMTVGAPVVSGSRAESASFGSWNLSPSNGESNPAVVEPGEREFQWLPLSSFFCDSHLETVALCPMRPPMTRHRV